MKTSLLLSIFMWIISVFMIFFMLAVFQYANAEGWFCEEESSEKQGNTILACGVGDGLDEATARRSALNHAIEEFNTICSMTSECPEKKRTMHPKRMACHKERVGGGILIKCYRLIEVSLED